MLSCNISLSLSCHLFEYEVLMRFNSPLKYWKNKISFFVLYSCFINAGLEMLHILMYNIFFTFAFDFSMLDVIVL